MKVAFYNIGCKVNFAEISEIKEEFIESGHDSVTLEDNPDIVMIHTCSVTKQADAETRKVIRRSVREHQNAYIVVFGCSAQLHAAELAEIEGVDLVLGNEEKYDILKLAGDFQKKGNADVFINKLKESKFHFASSEDNEVHTRTAFKIQDGCDYFCTYCAVPYARGRGRSMPFEGLKEKVLEFNSKNVFEIVLSGINIGEYHSPDGKNFTDVVKFLADADLDYRIRISSLEPNLLTDEIIEIVKNSRNFCPHFHIPLQSGSESILQKMKRRYKADYVAGLFAKVKNQIPNACIGVDVITGFPGETEELFKETYNLLEKADISYLHVFTYSVREGTIAAKMDNKVPKPIKKERTNILRALSEQKNSEFYQTQLNSVHYVLPERFNPVTNRWNAWTENYVKTEFTASPDLKRSIYKVELTDFQDKIVIGKLL
jgi:threonylcarbamoyladenosine tRNA methylthiotransferase MtaB